MGGGLIPSTKHTVQYNTIFNILLFFITLLFFLTWQILLLIFNYFFLFILNHTCLLSPRFLHFILLNFITFSFTLLHLRFAFLLICNFYVFYQHQCGNASSQVLSLKFLNMIFFKLHRYLCSFLFHFFFFLLRFFGLQNANLFWF